MWQQPIEQNDEVDNARDERDYNVLHEHAIFARDEAEPAAWMRLPVTPT